MLSPFFLLACAFSLLASVASVASGALVEHTFHVGNLTVQRLCQEQTIIAVNGRLPGPTIGVSEGDTLVIHVLNKSPYSLTIHWHGVFQLLSPWADGPGYVTQCPMQPGTSYTYKFTITGQEGTLWWHAHSSWLRATVYGGLIIRPRRGRSYPFIKPDNEFPIILGEWWNGNVVDIENEALTNGATPNISDAFTINGQPGDLYPCSKMHTHKLMVVRGKTYLLRIINAALNNQLFFKIANHNFTIVGMDATYTQPYHTDIVVIAPGQTIDVLFNANQSPGTYYMAAHSYASAQGAPFDNTTTTGIIQYERATSSVPQMPILPAFNDTQTAHKFYSNQTSLKQGPHWIQMPQEVDEHMFITEGLGLSPCDSNTTCAGPNGMRLSASMNNASFQLPSKSSILEAYYNKMSGIYTEDFPSNPPMVFDYTNASLVSSNLTLLLTEKATRVKKLKFNATVQIVFQNTALVGVENHPIHLHSFNFFVLAQGFGNYNPLEDSRTFNLINPQQRNTIAVPAGGWAVIRFQANNPGVWFMHCHLDVHLPWGFATAFIVENGPTPSSMLPHPPFDLPQC